MRIFYNSFSCRFIFFDLRKFSMFYLFCFLCCFIFIVFFENNNYLVNKKLIYVLPFIFLAFLAGGRSTNIGTDIRYYAQSVWDQNLSYIDINDFINNYVLEFCYEFTAFIISRLTSDIHWFFFASHIIIILFLACGLYLYSKYLKISYAVCFALYCLSTFNYSLNIIRQSFAVSIIFFFSYFLINKKYVLFFLGCCIATSFHNSGIAGFGIGGVYIFYSQKKGNFAFLRNFIIIAMIIMLFFQMHNYIKLFVDLGVIPTRFIVNESDYQTQTSSFVYAFLELPFAITSILTLLFHRNNTSFEIFLYFPIFSFVLALVNMNYGFAHRFLYYFQIFNIILIPYCVSNLFKNTLQKICVNLIFILYFGVKWYYSVIIVNAGETYPYEWNWIIF